MILYAVLAICYVCIKSYVPCSLTSMSLQGGQACNAKYSECFPGLTCYSRQGIMTSKYFYHKWNCIIHNSPHRVQVDTPSLIIHYSPHLVPASQSLHLVPASHSLQLVPASHSLQLVPASHSLHLVPASHWLLILCTTLYSNYLCISLGCGGYADNAVGAVSCCGHGESISKVCLAHRIISAMSRGKYAPPTASSLPWVVVSMPRPPYHLCHESW